MRRNTGLVIGIVMLFMLVFFLGNQNYFHIKHTSIVQDGVATIHSGQLNNHAITKLDGEWSFYPNVLIPPNTVLHDGSMLNMKIILIAQKEDKHK